MIDVKDTVPVPVLCRSCDLHKYVPISFAQYENWVENRDTLPHVQDHFPGLSEDHRELLLSGICGSCFDEMFVQ